jgi:hypothetical protein
MVTSILLAVAAIVLGFGLLRAIRAYLETRGVRVVTCVENRRPAAIALAAWRAVFTALFGRRDLRIEQCSRWPAWSGCAQACLKEVRDAPRATRVEGILGNWCQYNACIYCGAPMAKAHVGAHEPHLIDRNRRIFEWKEIPPEEMSEKLRQCEPVCETCVGAETRTW